MGKLVGVNVMAGDSDNEHKMPSALKNRQMADM